LSLLVVLAGSATVTVAGEDRLLDAGEAIIIEKGRTRRIAAGPDGARYLSVHTDEDRSRSLRRPPVPREQEGQRSTAPPSRVIKQRRDRAHLRLSVLRLNPEQLAEFRECHPSGRPGRRRARDRRGDEEDRMFALEYRIVRADGSVAWVPRSRPVVATCRLAGR
jgi:hypothetical protein